VHLVDGHQPVGDHLVELRQERVDPFGGVDDDDHHRQVLRQRQQPRGVQLTGGSEPLHAPIHRRAG
jgi:hypothetical protein